MLNLSAGTGRIGWPFVPPWGLLCRPRPVAGHVAFPGVRGRAFHATASITCSARPSSSPRRFVRAWGRRRCRQCAASQHGDAPVSGRRGYGGIALWLGHESLKTTHVYVEADLTTKERALGLQALQQAFEETLRRTCIAALCTRISNTTPSWSTARHKKCSSPRSNEHFIKVPFVARLRSLPPHLVGEVRKEFQAPLPVSGGMNPRLNGAS